MARRSARADADLRRGRRRALLHVAGLAHGSADRARARRCRFTSATSSIRSGSTCACSTATCRSYVSGLFNLVVGAGARVQPHVRDRRGPERRSPRAPSRRRLTPKRIVHVIAAVAFLTAPPIALNVQLGLLPLFWAFTAPLLVADALDVVSGRRPVRPIRLAVLLGARVPLQRLLRGVRWARVRADRRRRRGTPTATGAPSVPSPRRCSSRSSCCCRSSFPASSSTATSRRTASTPSCCPTATSSPPTRCRSSRSRRVRRSCSRGRRSSRRASFGSPTCVTRSRRRSFPASCSSPASWCSSCKRSRRRLPLLSSAAVLFVFGLGPSLKVAGNFVWKHGGRPVSWLPVPAAPRDPGLGRAAGAGAGRVRARRGARRGDRPRAARAAHPLPRRVRGRRGRRGRVAGDEPARARCPRRRST